MTSLQEDADALGGRVERISAPAERSATGFMRDALRVARREITAEWVRRFGDVDTSPDTASDFAAWVLARLLPLLAVEQVQLEPIEAAQQAAYRLGVREAYRRMDLPAVEHDPPSLQLDLSRTLQAATNRLTTALSPSRLADGGFPAVMAATRAVELGAEHVEAVTAREVTTATSRGVRDVAQRQGWHVVWVAERDACLQCLAYAGASAPAGVPLMPDSAIADVRATPVFEPAAHPYCRCVLEPHNPADTSVVAALKREARRSVLRGWADDGESQAAQVRAAERLLAAGSGMPASVEKVARQAIKNGRFRRRGNG